MRKTDTPIATCGNITLYKQDLELLDAPNWINDRIIAFYAEYLNEQSAKNRDKQTVFCVDPSLVFWLLYCNDWNECVETLKNITGYEYILFPLNDSDALYSPESPLTGSHWTLLVFIPNRKLFIEYDSLQRSTPSKNGKAFADKLEKLFNLTGSQYVMEKVPTQTNNYDCGIYVMRIMELYAQYSAPPPLQTLHESLPSDQLTEKRKQLRQLFSSFS